MTIRKKNPGAKPVIDLTGPEGNAYCLLGIARKLAKSLHMDVNAITSEMTSGDYEHLINVFDREFGEFIDLER